MGKGGETITSIRERSGARMQLDPEDRFAADRPLRIVGTEEQVKTARLMVIELFKEHDPAAAGVLALSTRAMNSTDVISNLDQYRAVRREIPIPRSSVGRVIGRGGETIRRLQETSGARIQFSDGTVRMTPISLLPFWGFPFASPSRSDTLLIYPTGIPCRCAVLVALRPCSSSCAQLSSFAL